MLITDSSQSGKQLSWKEAPLTTPEEAGKSHASLSFAAKTSTSEKIQRIFNGLIFFIAGAKLLTIIPFVSNATSKIHNNYSSLINKIPLTQFPALLKITNAAPKVIVSIALILAIRKIAAVAINFIVYPAARESLFADKEFFDKARSENFKNLNDDGYLCKRIALNKSGINYDAFAIAHNDLEIRQKNHWVMIAGGNLMIGEEWIVSLVNQFSKKNLNILYVNGPGVGRSSGFPTRYSIGAGQEVGLQFLENVVKAKKIILYGTSLGGGAQAEAILNHKEFKKDVNYMVWSDRSFDTLSNAASSMITRLLKPLFFVLGIELDGVKGTKKLEQLNISHIITQNNDQNPQEENILSLNKEIKSAGTDGVIPNNASLFVGLQKAGLKDSDRIKCYGNNQINHNGQLPRDVSELVNKDIENFLNPTTD